MVNFRVVEPIAAFCVVVLASACGTQTQYHPQTTIRASADTGVAKQHLGRPYDANFEAIAGEGSLFPEAKVRETEISEVRLQTVTMTNEAELKANLSAWRVLNAGIDTSSSNRYAAIRNYYITRVLELDDSDELRDPPKGARYYLYRIFLGHIYEAVVHGAESDFHAGIAANLGKYGGNLGYLESNYSLKTDVFARGVRNKTGNALYSRTQEEFERNYKPDYEHPVPVFAEYRSIPTREAPKSTEIKFQQAPAFESGEYVISVDSAQIKPMKKNGKAWDFLGGPPDPQADVHVQACQRKVMSTAIDSNTTRPAWSDVGKAKLTGDDRLCVKVWDSDVMGFDPIGVCESEKLSEQEMAGNKIVLKNCDQVKKLVLTISRHGE